MHDGRDQRCRRLAQVQGSPVQHLVRLCSWSTYELTGNSENTLIGATNDQNGEVNVATDYVAGEPDATIPEMMKRFKGRGQPWMIVTDVGPP